MNNHQKMENGGNKTRSLVELREAVCKSAIVLYAHRPEIFHGTSAIDHVQQAGTLRPNHVHHSSQHSRHQDQLARQAAAHTCPFSLLSWQLAGLQASSANCPNLLLGPCTSWFPRSRQDSAGRSPSQGSPTCQNCRQRLRLRRLQEFTLLCADPIVASTGTSPASSPSGNAPISGCLSHQRSRSRTNASFTFALPSRPQTGMIPFLHQSLDLFGLKPLPTEW